MHDVPKYDGPRMVSLIDGSMVWNDSEAYRHECEARSIAAMPQRDRRAWLFDLERVRGVDATERLRKTVDEVIAITAAGAA